MMTPPGDFTEHRRADELLTRLPPPQPLSSTQVARIRMHIDNHRRRPFHRRFAVLTMLGIGLFGTVAAAVYLKPDDHAAVVPPSLVLPDVRIEPPVSSKPRAPAEMRVAAPTLEIAHGPAATLGVAPRPTLPARPRRVGVESPAIPSEPPAQPDEREGPLGAESRMVGTALRQLRQQHNPRAALETLDQYTAAFPRGTLAAEARAARIEALLGSGNKPEALALLDGGSVKSELAVARGELRLEAGRIEEAARDFETALIGTNDEIEQRALYGRAACRVRLGNKALARQDLEEYLRRFPGAKSAASAKSVLERIR